MCIRDRYLTTKNPVTAEVMNPAANAPGVPAPSPCLTSSIASHTPAPPMMGAAIMKANFAAASLFKPENMPADMVMPERDTPGARARTCANPTAVSYTHLRAHETRHD